MRSATDRLGDALTLLHLRYDGPLPIERRSIDPALARRALDRDAADLVRRIARQREDGLRAGARPRFPGQDRDQVIAGDKARLDASAAELRRLRRAGIGLEGIGHPVPIALDDKGVS